MAGSLVVNREVERSKNPNRSWPDDVWHIFTFFLSLYRQIFTPPWTMFSPTFFPLEERVPNNDNAVIKYEKKFDLSLDGCVQSTIQYKTLTIGKNYDNGTEYGNTYIHISHNHETCIDGLNSKGYYPQPDVTLLKKKII